MILEKGLALQISNSFHILISKFLAAPYKLVFIWFYCYKKRTSTVVLYCSNLKIELTDLWKHNCRKTIKISFFNSSKIMFQVTSKNFSLLEQYCICKLSWIVHISKDSLYLQVKLNCPFFKRFTGMFVLH